MYKIGEIYVRPVNGFSGYIDNEDVTNDVLDEDGWIHSGDLGYYDEEMNIFIVDRKKDIINYFGRPIAPSEMESFIINIPGVKSVCVVGIPDILANDLPTAIVIKDTDFNLHEEDIILECSSELFIGISNRISKSSNTFLSMYR
jgi:4-coumarate--CoA ligase